MPKLVFIMAGAIALLAAHAADAHEYRKGDLTIVHPWARPTAEGAAAAAVYLVIKNAGPDADKLVSVASPAATKTELHETRDENGVMKMRAVEGGIEIAPGASQALKPGGYHIMLIGLTHPLKAGDSFPVTLKFHDAGAVQVQSHVRPMSQ